MSSLIQRHFKPFPGHFSVQETFFFNSSLIFVFCTLAHTWNYFPYTFPCKKKTFIFNSSLLFVLFVFTHALESFSVRVKRSLTRAILLILCDVSYTVSCTESSTESVFQLRQVTRRPFVRNCIHPQVLEREREKYPGSTCLFFLSGTCGSIAYFSFLKKPTREIIAPLQNGCFDKTVSQATQ